jgi:hypothetical protein
MFETLLELCKDGNFLVKRINLVLRSLHANYAMLIYIYILAPPIVSGFQSSTTFNSIFLENSGRKF